MRSRLEQLANRLEEIDALLSEPETGQDMKRFTGLSRERAELEPVANAFREFVRAEDGYQQARELMADPDMKEMAVEEMQQCKERIQALEGELQILLLPKDPDDSRSVFLEIRAAQEVMRAHCSAAISCACTPVMQSKRAGGWS